jgi:hypothetical protein
MHERWKRAVIHLEGAADSESARQRARRWQELPQQTPDADRVQAESASKGSRDVRYQGTAIFLLHEGRHFLLTARHVLHDELGAQHDVEDTGDLFKDAPENFRESVLTSSREHAPNRIFGIIFRVPSLDEVLASDPDEHREFLMNLEAGVPWLAPYTFSEPALDLAIVSLDSRNRKFTAELLAQGYSPIAMEDIADEPTEEGTEVFTVGYPSATATLGQLNLSGLMQHWASASFSTPTFAFGRVSMLHEKLEYFWCDMSVYPGNSGGPVVERDRLVGIISNQAWIEGQVLDQGGSELPLVAELRIPFAQTIKARHLRPLIAEQLEKDRRVAEIREVKH